MKAFNRKLGMVAIGFGALALAGVGAEAQDAAQEGTYELVEVAGSPLPVVMEEDEACREELLSGTLTLGADGEWALVTTEREVCGDRTEEDEDREEGNYTVDGQTIRFQEDDGEAEEDADDDAAEDEGENDAQESDADELAEGTVSDGTLTVRLDDGQTVLVFRQ